jgi:hypothetical protein
VFLDDAVTKAQAKTGALPHLFCGEEWVEYFREVFLKHLRKRSIPLPKPMDTVAPRRLNRGGAKGEGWLILKIQPL